MEPEVDTQPQERETGTVTPEAGSEDEAIALFNQRAQSKAAEGAETPTDEPDEEPEDGNPEDDPGEGDPQENLEEVEYEGKNYSVPPELKKALLRQADYSRHVQEVTSQKKDYAQRIERADQLIEGAGKFAEHMATIKALDAQLEQFNDLDIDKLAAEDPARASIVAFKVLSLKQARDKANGEAKEFHQRLAQQRSENTQAARLEMFKTLEKDLKGWGDDLGRQISEYAVKAGFKADDLANLSDARVVIALDKARKFDAIQEGKAKALEKVGAVQKPVFKPGTPRHVDKTADAMAKFRKSNSPEDAEAVFQARARRG